MGNRAVITTEDGFKNNGVGLYLHWNGGRDSVEAFLQYAKLIGIPDPTQDYQYFWGQFTNIVGNYMGSSYGLGNVKNLDCDNSDNGVYIIGKNFEIIDRKYFDGKEQNEYPLVEMLKDIDNSQPETKRLEYVLKDWSGDYSELVPNSLNPKVSDNPFSSIEIINVEKTDKETPYKVEVELNYDSIVSNYTFYFNSLEEVNFYKNFADNGFDEVFGGNGVDLVVLEKLYEILNDPRKTFKVDNDMERENHNDFVPAIWSSTNIIMYEQENFSFPVMSEEEFDRFKKFIENKEFLKENDIEIKNEPKKVR